MNPSQHTDAGTSRLRRTPALRSLVRETTLHPSQLIEPIFVAHRDEDAGDIPSMPGVRRERLADVGERARAIADLGIGGILLFGVPDRKDAEGSGAWQDDGVVPQAVARVREAVGDRPAIITDVCLCQYTDHGHCGVTGPHGLDIHESVARYAETAVSHARAGADVVAPSGMIDGTVAHMRDALNQARLERTAILAYSAKYASAFYGPFRDAACSTPAFGDRRAHQMDPANAREAVREALQDIREGADAVMVKPAGMYLDVVRAIRDAQPGVPLAAYQVSGEYAMLHSAIRHGWLDERGAVTESLLSIRRAGADMVITYFASRAARWLAGGSA